MEPKLDGDRAIERAREREREAKALRIQEGTREKTKAEKRLFRVRETERVRGVKKTETEPDSD